MTPCQIRGCHSLETKCADCGRVVSTAEFPRDEWISCKNPPEEDYLECLSVYEDAYQNEISSIGEYSIVPAIFNREKIGKSTRESWISIEEGLSIYPSHWRKLPKPPEE